MPADGSYYKSPTASVILHDLDLSLGTNVRPITPKIVLYGLFHALRAAKVWLIGLHTFTVEVDAKYIKGILSNPDAQPNAAMNRWLVGISHFNFQLKHVPGTKHAEPNSLSR